MVNEIHEQDRKKSEYEIAPGTIEIFPFSPYSPVRGQESTFLVLKTRISWLVTLMLLQSFSSMIMDRYSSMLNQHIVVATFVTTLIGTGGNAGINELLSVLKLQGNQVISYVISGLSTGRISKRPRAVLLLLRRELVHAVITGSILACFMFLRVYFSVWQIDVTLALTLSMFFIVSFSVLFGLSVPLVLTSLGMDTSSGAGTTFIYLGYSFLAPVLATLMDVVVIEFSAHFSQYQGSSNHLFSEL